MNWKCFFGWHEWEIKGTYRLMWNDFPAQTDILYKCIKCLKTKTKRVNGAWTKEYFE